MRKHLQLMWARLTLHRGEVGAVVLVITLGAALVLLGIRPGGFLSPTNAGFGPDWECTQMPKSEPICVKKTPAPAPR